MHKPLGATFTSEAFNSKNTGNLELILADILQDRIFNKGIPIVSCKRIGYKTIYMARVIKIRVHKGKIVALNRMKKQPLNELNTPLNQRIEQIRFLHEKNQKYRRIFETRVSTNNGLVLK